MLADLTGNVADARPKILGFPDVPFLSGSVEVTGNENRLNDATPNFRRRVPILLKAGLLPAAKVR